MKRVCSGWWSGSRPVWSSTDWKTSSWRKCFRRQTRDAAVCTCLALTRHNAYTMPHNVMPSHNVRPGGAGALEAAQAALSTSEAAKTRAEAALSQAIAAHDADVAHLEATLEAALQRQRALEAELQALQVSRAAMEEQHSADETQLLHGLRGEAAALEQRLREEQAAHAASIHQVCVWTGARCASEDIDHMRLCLVIVTRIAQAEQRQRELETTLSESAADLASMQRQLAERQAATAALQAALDQANARPASTQAAQSDQALSTLRAQCDALAAQLADSRAQLAAAREEAARLAERVAEEGPAGSPVGPPGQDLEARLHELSELLYAKQNQYERLAAEKAAQQLAFQRQLQEAHVGCTADVYTCIVAVLDRHVALHGRDRRRLTRREGGHNWATDAAPGWEATWCWTQRWCPWTRCPHTTDWLRTNGALV